MKNKIFCDKLAHYANREPKNFLQMDGFYMPEGGDSDMHPDKDGDVLEASSTVELMLGSSVRVLIPYDTDLKAALRQMKKLTKWLKHRPDLIERNAKPTSELEDFDESIPF